MNRNKNFFDGLEQDWSETLTDIYTKSNIDVNFNLEEITPLYSYKLLNEYNDLNVISKDVKIGSIRTISLISLNEVTIEDNDYGYDDLNISVITKMSNIMVNEIPLKNIILSDTQLDKNKDILVLTNDKMVNDIDLAKSINRIQTNDNFDSQQISFSLYSTDSDDIMMMFPYLDFVKRVEFKEDIVKFTNKIYDQK